MLIGSVSREDRVRLCYSTIPSRIIKFQIIDYIPNKFLVIIAYLLLDRL